jgi:hypothetical protein
MCSICFAKLAVADTPNQAKNLAQQSPGRSEIRVALET